jgi:polysaccharide biosynthesis transport protein
MAAALRVLSPAPGNELSPASLALRPLPHPSSPIAISPTVLQNSPPLSPEPLPAPVRSDSSWLDSQRAIIIATSVAISTAALTPLLNQSPIYEGSFQLKSAQATLQGQYIQKPEHTTAQPSVVPPTAIDPRTLKSAKLLEPVLQKLQLPHLDYRSLIRNLTLTTEGGQTKVTYRDADPQRVQLVLDQLSQAYVAYGQECQSETCRGIRYIEEQIPQSQTEIQKLSAAIEKLHQQYGVKNLQAQLNVLNQRTTDLAKQEVQLQGKLAEAKQTYRQLQQRMALKENETIALQLLSQDSRYRMLLTQFQTLDRQFAPQFANLEGNDSAVKSLQVQHQRISDQLTQQAQSLLPQYLSNPAANTQNPVFQNQSQLQLLQQSILVLHSSQLMEARLATMAAAKQAIDQQRQAMIQLLGQYNQLRQTLDAETLSLHTYFDQLEQLQKLSASDVELEITQEPELLRDRVGQPTAIIPDWQRNLGIAAAVGLLVGVGTAAAGDRRRQSEASGSVLDLGDLPVDVLISKAKGLADLRLREQFQQVA